MSPESLTPTVQKAIAELADRFGEANVTLEHDGQGGARVTMTCVPLPAGLDRSESWVGFVIPYDYDDVQVYGHHFPADLRCANGCALTGGGIGQGQWNGMGSLVVSRSSNRWRKGTDTALLKLLKVVEFLGERCS